MPSARKHHRYRKAARYVRLLVSMVAGLLCLAAQPGEVALSPNNCDKRCEPTSCRPLDLGCLFRSVTRIPSLTSCTVARTECKIRLGLYRLYISNMAWGVSMHRLPDHYLNVLAPHFPGVDLTQVNIGFSDRQPHNNATTDCKNIYFNDAVMVRQAVQGTLFIGSTNGRPDPEKTNMDWLLHELRHVEQCQLWGGRDTYALRWMHDMSQAMVRQMSLEQQSIHADQAMEKDADRVAYQVLQKLAPAIDRRGYIRTN